MSLIKKYITKKWWAYGLFWGFWMWLGTQILFPLLADESKPMGELLFSFAFWLGFGLFWGWAITPREESKEG